jgi:hypothetical protein
VAAPLLASGVAMTDDEASLRVASPSMVFIFLLRRWLGRQDGLRKDFWIECMSSCSIRAVCAAAAAMASGLSLLKFDMLVGENWLVVEFMTCGRRQLMAKDYVGKL